MLNREELLKITEYILNRASLEDLVVFEKAIARRKEDIKSGRYYLDLKSSAQQTSALIQQQMGSLADIQKMAKNFIEQMVRQVLPDIPEDHLKTLLKEWLPQSQTTPEQQYGGRASRLPPEVIYSMVTQFIDYSKGRMKPEEKQQLRPDWNKQYWEHFSPELQQLLANFLSGNLTEKQFWIEYKKI